MIRDVQQVCSYLCVCVCVCVCVVMWQLYYYSVECCCVWFEAGEICVPVGSDDSLVDDSRCSAGVFVPVCVCVCVCVCGSCDSCTIIALSAAVWFEAGEICVPVGSDDSLVDDSRCSAGVFVPVCVCVCVCVVMWQLCYYSVECCCVWFEAGEICVPVGSDDSLVDDSRCSAGVFVPVCVCGHVTAVLL